jgi:hypothetical protein
MGEQMKTRMKVATMKCNENRNQELTDRVVTSRLLKGASRIYLEKPLTALANMHQYLGPKYSANRRNPTR